MNDALLRTARSLHQAGRLSEATHLYRQILEADPKHFGALVMLGVALLESGQREEANRIADDGIKTAKASRDLYNLGYLLERLERTNDALLSYNAALALKPDYFEAIVHRGLLLFQLKHYEDALDSFDAAVAMQASEPGVWFNRANTLFSLQRYDEALASYDKALALQPAYVGALENRATTLYQAGRFDEAARDYDRVLSLEPSRRYILGYSLHAKLHACDWSSLERDRPRIAAGLRAGERIIHPFANLALSSSLEDQLSCSKIRIADRYPRSSPPPARKPNVHGKIRLAYFSADFCAHATAYLMAAVFEQHDKSRFELIALSNSPDDDSAMRKRLEAAFDHFIDIRRTSDADVAALMTEMEIDIAIDLKGFTEGGRPGIFALRPAPVQASYLGYPGTMGADFIDYIVADGTVIPEEHQSYYSEKIVRLPGSYQCNDSKRAIAETAPTRAEAGLPETGFVFCCFNNNYKITPEIFGIWMRLLHDVKGGVLWLLEGNAAALRNLRNEAAARGVDADRLIFAPRQSLENHLARHRLADLFLDTLPYNAHTTASDALWAGLPVLTVLGTTFAGRVAASLLHAVGLPELIAPSVAAYEKLALRLARDPSPLAELKARLARNRLAFPLFDTSRFTRNLEATYMAMIERHCRGDSPAHFAVDDCA